MGAERKYDVDALLAADPGLTARQVREHFGVAISTAHQLLRNARHRRTIAQGAPPWRHPTPHAEAGRQAAISKARDLIAAGDDPSAAINYVRELHPDAAIRVEDLR